MPTCDSHPYGLALHTTSPDLGLAMSNFVDDPRSSTWNLGRNLSTHLHHYLTDFLRPQTWQELGFIAIAKGPGSFTSTRLGMVTARTLAQQLDIPLFAISSLAALAWLQYTQGNSSPTPGRNAPLSQPPGQPDAIALQMPAGRGQLFTAIYQLATVGLGLTPILPDGVMIPDRWNQTLDRLEMPYQLIEAPVNLGDCAIGILELAHLDWQQGKHPHWSEALPFYGQHPVETQNERIS